jgi:putative restriction endonuclease
MKQQRRNWTRDELIVAFNLYCKIAFSKINYRNPLIIKLSEAIDRTPSAVAWKLVNFASLDPSLTKRGIRGATNTGKLDKVIFEEFTENWEDLAFESESLLKKLFNKENNIVEDKQFFEEGKEVERSVKMRVNQSFFRDTILSSYGFKCCLTGIDIPALLIASHIVPWSKDPKNRLNPQNGLCLNNLHDQAFDRGYITFDNDLRLVLSKQIIKNKEEYVQKYFKEFEGKSLRLPERFVPDEQFIKYHHENIFLHE